MKALHLIAIATATLSALPALAQSRSDAARPGAASTTTYPWQGPFWSYIGGSVGGAGYDINCPAGLLCDNDTAALKLFTGGRFNRHWGMEVAYVNMGKANKAGGDVEAHGLNVSALGILPLSSTTEIFGKLGATYGRTKVSGTVPAVRTGSDDDAALSFGVGIQFALNQRLGLRLEAERYRFQFIDEDRRNIDTVTVGLQYRF